MEPLTVKRVAIDMPSLYPKEVYCRDFPLNASRSKLVRVGIDAVDLKPYVLLLGDTSARGTRPWLRMTVMEFEEIISTNVYKQVKDSLTGKAKIPAINYGDISLKVGLTAVRPLVFVSHKRSPAILALAEISWDMLHSARYVFLTALLSIDRMAARTQSEIGQYMRNCKEMLAKKGYSTPNSISDIQEKVKRDELLTDVFLHVGCDLPEIIQYELIAYHLDFLKDRVFDYMRHDLMRGSAVDTPPA